MGTEYKRVPIKGYEGEYEIDTLGNVYSLKTNIWLKPNDSKNPYYHVHLLHNGKRVAKKVHRLVAEAFIPNPDNLPQVNHKDEDKHNNNVDNLEWCTAQYNMRYGTAIERAKLHRLPIVRTDDSKRKLSEKMKRHWETHKHPLKMFEIECINDGTVYLSYSEAGRAYGLSHKTVHRMCDDGHEVRGIRFRYLKKGRNLIAESRAKKMKGEN